MNRKQIIQMAREAGFTPARDEFLFLETLERFAAIVAAHEREECAKVCYELPWKDMRQIPSNLAFAAAIRKKGLNQ